MVIWGGIKKKAKWLPGGRRVKRRCSHCGETCVFRECVVERRVSIYFVELWKGEHTAFACSNCDEVMDLEDTQEPQLSEREQAQLAKQREKMLAEAKRERERAEADKQREVDALLAEIKRKQGK